MTSAVNRRAWGTTLDGDDSAASRLLRPYLTTRRWFRELIDQSEQAKSHGGQNRTGKATEDEIVRLATENGWGNDAWGAKRIVGEMLKLGVHIAKSTVSAILRRHGIPPAPQRGRVTNGDRVIFHDPATSVAIDFAKVMVLDQGRLCRVSILIAIHLGTREMEIVNVAHDPEGRITVQCARNLTMDGVGFFKRLGIKTVIMDRDPIFTEEFRHLLSEAGCEPHRITPHCPWENGYAERLIRSLKESLLRKCLFTSESALRLALSELQTYFVTTQGVSVDSPMLLTGVSGFTDFSQYCTSIWLTPEGLPNRMRS